MLKPPFVSILLISISFDVEDGPTNRYEFVNINERWKNVSGTFVLAKNQNLLYSRPIRKYVAEVYAKRGEADSCRFLELEWRPASKAASW